MDYIAFGKRMKQYRKLQNMTQMKLAERTGLSVGHVSNMENGKSEASIESLIKISNVLHVATDQLLCDSLDGAVEVYKGELEQLFDGCSKEEVHMLVELVKTARPWVKRS